MKPHNLDPAAEHAWPGPSVENRSGPPPGLTLDVMKSNVVDLACEREKHRVVKSSMFSPPKRVMIKKKVGRRPSVPEVAPPVFPSTASPKAPFKMDSPSTVHAAAEHASGDYFFGDTDETRFVQLKDNTVAFKEIRALQEPYSSSNRYTSQVDLTGSRLSSSPAHFQPGISHNAALASFHKVTWPGPKAAGLEQQPYPTSAAMPSRSPVSPQNSFASPAGFFECLSPRASGASRTWTSPKPKVGPDISSDSNAGVGHAFHPVTPSNKLLPYPPYHPSKSCAQSNDQHRSVIKPQLGALQHPMVPVTAPLRPTTQIPFGLPVSHSSAPTPTHPLHNPYRAGWVPSRTPYATRDTLAHYDPRHFMRRPSEQYSAAVSQGQMLSTRFAPTAGTPMYQMPRHTLPRGLAPDASQAYWPTPQHTLASAPPFSKQ